MSNQVVSHREAPPGADRQRDQEFLEHSPEEEADPDGLRPDDAQAKNRLLCCAASTHCAGQPPPARGAAAMGRPRRQAAG